MIYDPAGLREFALRYTAAWCSRSASSVAGFFSSDAGFSVNGGDPVVGRKAITALVQGYMEAFPDLQVLFDDVSQHEDRAVYNWTLAGTNTGAGGTGHRVRISGFEVWRIAEDGLIAESQGHYDSAAYQHQLQHGV